MRTREEIEDRLYSIRCKIYRNAASCSELNHLNEMADLLEWVLSNKIEDIIKDKDTNLYEKVEEIEKMGYRTHSFTFEGMDYILLMNLFRQKDELKKRIDILSLACDTTSQHNGKLIKENAEFRTENRILKENIEKLENLLRIKEKDYNFLFKEYLKLKDKTEKE